MVRDFSNSPRNAFSDCPLTGPLSGQPGADLRLCEAGIQGVPYTQPDKMPGEGVLYATHEICLETLGKRDVATGGQSYDLHRHKILRGSRTRDGKRDSHNYVS